MFSSALGLTGRIVQQLQHRPHTPKIKFRHANKNKSSESGAPLKLLRNVKKDPAPRPVLKLARTGQQTGTTEKPLPPKFKRQQLDPVEVAEINSGGATKYYN